MTGWLLVVAALIVNVAVHRGATTDLWVWCLAALVLICAAALRTRRRRSGTPR